MDAPWRRVGRDVNSAETSRGNAAAATWIFRGRRVAANFDGMFTGTRPLRAMHLEGAATFPARRPDVVVLDARAVVRVLVLDVGLVAVVRGLVRRVLLVPLGARGPRGRGRDAALLAAPQREDRLRRVALEVLADVDAEPRRRERRRAAEAEVVELALERRELARACVEGSRTTHLRGRSASSAAAVAATPPPRNLSASSAAATRLGRRPPRIPRGRGYGRTSRAPAPGASPRAAARRRAPSPSRSGPGTP